MFDSPSPASWQHARWQPAQTLRPPPAVRRWLLDEGSLTARLQAQGPFRVHLLRHAWLPATPGERRRLRLSPRSATLVREVLLLCDGVPRVYARSILPATTLRGRHRHLRRFGARSLGAHLFRQGGTRRDPFELIRLPSGTRLPGMQSPARGPLWGRRSVFYLEEDAPLLVAELFLPAFRPWTEND